MHSATKSSRWSFHSDIVYGKNLYYVFPTSQTLCGYQGLLYVQRPPNFIFDFSLGISALGLECHVR